MVMLNHFRNSVFPLALVGLYLISQAHTQTQAMMQTGTEEKLAAESSNQFAVDLHKALSTQPGNLFYSPASISIALGMTCVGAEGETRSQMERVLHVPEDKAAWLKSNAGLVRLFNRKSDGFEINLANRLWGQQDFTFQPNYLETVEKSWRAPLGVLDFFNQAETARTTINGWVESQTNARIKDLLPQGSIDANTRLVLTNAIFFKADWASEFKSAATADRPFAVNDQKSVMIPLMSQRGNFQYYGDEQIQYLRLPYKAGEVAMELVLPKTVQGLSEVESNLTLSQLNQWNTQSRNHDVQVFLPRFKMNLAFSLKPILSAMGMERAFSGSAEFGGMTTEDELQISEVFHKAFVEVDEKGTEAAAATGVVMTLRSAQPRDPVEFRADRPFLMLLRHQPTGAILFLGRVADPSN